MKGKAKFKYNYVLLVDDNELDNFISEKIIESCNFSKNVYSSSSGVYAIELLKNLQVAGSSIEKEVLPEIIFVDINMPIMDGFQFVTQLIKQNDASLVPQLVFLTTSVNSEDRMKASVLAEKSLFINKPLTEDALQNIYATISSV
jgi:CheY-like chemotaxis protein